MPIATIVARAHGAADLDAILNRLRQEIAAADYPYPIDQDLGELAAQGAELRDSLVWAPGRIIADDPEAIARGKAADDVVAFIRGRVAEMKQELLAEAPICVLPAGAQATVKALHDRDVRVRVLTNSLASNNQLAAGVQDHRSRSVIGSVSTPSSGRRRVARASSHARATRRRFGYRRLHILLRREGYVLNRKKTQRLYREEGLFPCASGRGARRQRARGHRC